MKLRLKYIPEQDYYIIEQKGLFLWRHVKGPTVPTKSDKPVPPVSTSGYSYPNKATAIEAMQMMLTECERRQEKLKHHKIVEMESKC